MLSISSAYKESTQSKQTTKQTQQRREGENLFSALFVPYHIALRSSTPPTPSPYLHVLCIHSNTVHHKNQHCSIPTQERGKGHLGEHNRLERTLLDCLQAHPDQGDVGSQERKSRFPFTKHDLVCCNSMESTETTAE